MTDPPVGACTCASGSQVWTGHMGSLTAKEAKNASHKIVCSPPATRRPKTSIGSWGTSCPRSAMMFVVPESAQSAIIATSMSTEPSKV